MNLTKEQEEEAIRIINETLAAGQEVNLMDITRKVFKNDKLDGRCAEGKLIKKLFVSKSISFSTTEFKKVKDIVLDDAQMEFIKNNCGIMTKLEIAKEIFNSPSLVALSKEYEAVSKYIEMAGLNSFNAKDIKTINYAPPNAISRAIARINRYCSKEFKEETITENQRDSIEQLMRYLKSPRFIQMIEACEEQAERDLFESRFIAYTWDKPDLLEEELDIYIDICVSYVDEIQIQKIVKLLNQRLQEITEDPDGKASKALADTINTKNSEKDNCIKRRKSLMNDLIKKRSSRQQEEHEQNTILQLVHAFQKEEKRLLMAEMLERERALLGEKIEEYKDMPSYMANILGVSKEEILH